MPPLSTPPVSVSDVLPALAEFLCQRREQIMALWMDAVQKNPRIGAADPLDPRELADHLSALFDDLADRLRDAGSHGAHRWRQDDSLAEVTRELNIARHLVLAHGLDAFQDEHPEADAGELRRARQRILAFFEDTLTGRIEQYVDKQHEERDRLHARLRAASHARTAATQAGHDRLSDLFRRAPSFLAILSGPDHVFTSANARYCDLVGGRDLLHRPVRDALPEVVAQGFVDLLDRVYRTGEPFVANDVRVLFQNEPGQPPRECYVDFVYQPTHAADGSVDGVFVHGVDRTEQTLAQQALAKVAEQRRLALNSAQMGWWSYDVPNDEVHWDERLQAIFGLGRERIAYDQVIARVHPEDRQRLRDAVQASICPHDPAPCVIEYRVVHDDGAVRWVAARGTASFEGEGAQRRALSLVGTLTDITDAKAAQDARHLGAERHRLAIEGGQLGTFHWELPSRRVHWNERMKEFFFLPPGTEVSFEVASVHLHPDDREPTRRAVEEAIAGRRVYRVEYRAVSPADGRVRWLHATGQGVYDAATGAVTHVHGVAVDITAQKETAQALRAGEQKYRSLFNSIDTGFCVIEVLWDAQGRPNDYRFLEVNPAFAVHTGLRDTVGRTIREMQPDLEQVWFDRYGHVARTGQASRFMEGSDALERWFDVYAFALGEGADRRVAVLFSDISERRRVENALRAAKAEAEAASRAKDDFLAALSHELRTPLTPVLLTAEDLHDDVTLPFEVREKLGMMQRNIALEARLIDDLLDLTRITKGKLTLRAQECEAHSLAGLAVEIIRDEAQAKGITLAVEFAAVRTSFVGDPARVQQVFWNLLRNAVKFTPEGGQVSLRSRDEDDRLIIEVSDTGAGIAPEFLETIFRPFEQAGFANNANFGGLGLGLAIARAIVELHGGTIRAESAGPGRGATFRVELAAAARPMGVAGKEGQGDFLARPTGLPPSPLTAGLQRLLLVEDHEATLNVLTRLLTRAGYSVGVASSVAQARETARRERFDAVISDIGLPDGTGIELMQALHAEHGLHGIALTGYGMEDDLRRSREVGFVEHLVKPVDFAQLRRALTSLAATLAAAAL